MNVEPSRRQGVADVLFLPAGPGMSIGRKCMGCDFVRGALGGRGRGIWWRCAGCVGRRAVARAAA